jgi:peptide chain release factor 3
VVQLFSPLDGSPPIVGVIGALQLDVLGDRLVNEYGLAIAFEPAPCDALRWLIAVDPKEVERFVARSRASVAVDLDGNYVYLAPSSFYLDLAIERNPTIRFADIKTSPAR